MKKTSLIIFLSLLLLSSCYKIFSVVVPERVCAGQTFEVSFTVVDDGSSVQNFVNDWSYAGIRVPEGWTVTVPSGAHEQFAEDWVYYENGSKVASRHNMVECPLITEFYNEACPLNGYRWVGFESQSTVPKNISACWRNGCDSIRVTFLVTVPADCKPGRYAIDFLGGDEEDGAGVDKYPTLASAKDSHLLNVGTVASAYVKNPATNLSRTVEVLEPSAVEAVVADRATSPAFDLSGRPANAHSQGIVITNGKKTIRK